MDGFGPTICFVELLVDGKWTNSEKWQVIGVSHANGPVNNLLKASSCDAGTFWNADDGSADALGWNMTLTMETGASIAGFRYGIWDSSEEPKSFEIQALDSSAAFRSVLEVVDTATAGNCSRLSKTSVSTSPDDALVFTTHQTDTENGVTQFALCYAGVPKKGGTAAAVATATACASAAAKTDVAEVLAARNEFIAAAVPPLPAESDDRFQRKLLSVMKVNSLSQEGAVKQGWSTTW